MQLQSVLTAAGVLGLAGMLGSAWRALASVAAWLLRVAVRHVLRQSQVYRDADEVAQLAMQRALRQAQAGKREEALAEVALAQSALDARRAIVDDVV